MKPIQADHSIHEIACSCERCRSIVRPEIGAELKALRVGAEIGAIAVLVMAAIQIWPAISAAIAN